MSDPYNPTLVFIDLETTSLDEAHARATDIAWIVREPGKDDVTHQLHPSHLLHRADPESLAVSQYATRIAGADTIPTSQWLPQLLADLDGAVVVGAHVETDCRILRQAAARARLPVTWEQSVCCCTLALPLLDPMPARPRSLAFTADQLGVEYDPTLAHTALQDVMVARDVYDRVRELAGAPRQLASAGMT